MEEQQNTETKDCSCAAGGIFGLILLFAMAFVGFFFTDTYTKMRMEVGQCFMHEYDHRGTTIKVTELREFGVTVEIYENAKVTKENAYLKYDEFSSWERRDCHK